jgi:hypothetical protein
MVMTPSMVAIACANPQRLAWAQMMVRAAADPDGNRFCVAG